MVRNWKSAAGLLGLLSLGIGCASSGEQAADLRSPPAPRLAWSRPSEDAKKQTQTIAQSKDLVIPEYRFVTHSPELSLEGEDQLQRIASVLRESPHQLVIESSGPTAALRVVSQRSPEESGKLDQERRQYVIQKLLSLGITDAESRVVLESPESDAVLAKF
ncbi:MAG: hypothetical protein JWM11_1039 [Planctomycetaceae bacterium]|nr:hypothetical protein [Planctomycetaceae bacterium]